MSSRTPCAIVVALSTSVSYVITSFRFYSRSRSSNGFRWSLSDTIIVTSLVLQTCLTGISLTLLYLPRTEDPQTLGKWYEAATFLYFGTLWSIKISISVSLVRLTKRLDRAARLAKCCFYLICAAFPVAFFTELLQCIPISRLWEGTCDRARITAGFWTAIGLNIGTDVMLVIVPFPALLLITEKRTRIAISIVFGLAGIVVIASVVRAVLLTEQTAKASYLVVTLSHIEVATGIIISALPEASRSFTRRYLEWSHNKSYENWKFTNQQQSQRTTSGVIISTSENRETFTNHEVGGSPNRINDIEAESANGRPDSSSEQSVWRSGNTASTDHISPYPLERSSSTDEAQMKQGVEGTAVFEMKVL